MDRDIDALGDWFEALPMRCIVRVHVLVQPPLKCRIVGLSGRDPLRQPLDLITAKPGDRRRGPLKVAWLVVQPVGVEPLGAKP